VYLLKVPVVEEEVPELPEEPEAAPDGPEHN
jgi:hypothetical protein